MNISGVFVCNTTLKDVLILLKTIGRIPLHKFYTAYEIIYDLSQQFYCNGVDALRMNFILRPPLRLLFCLPCRV